MASSKERSMTERDRKRMDMRRRQFLARLGAVAGAAYLAPAFAQLGPARASDSFSSSDSGSYEGGGDSSSSSASAYSAPQRPRPLAPSRAREILISTRHPADLERLPALGFEVKARETSALLGVTLARISLPARTSMDEAMRQLRQHLPDTQIAENTYYETSELPCADGSCSAFDLIGWQPRDLCDAAPVIGMIDTGINPAHEALAGQNLTLITLDQGERDLAGRVHGTAVATLLIGSAQSRTPGLLPKARLVAVEAFFSDRVGEAADSFSVIRALEALVEAGVSVINMSFAGPDNPILSQAIDAVAARGIGLVAAAGNGGPAAPPAMPAAHPHVAAVTAVGRSLSVYRQAAAGSHIRLAAPGVQVWTAASVSGGRFRSGTSYAAPFVTAAMAVAALENPGATPASLIDSLAQAAMDLGAPGRDDVFGWGLVQTASLCTA
jgi:hypothetical protein